jgi:CspA family cold shock protein
LRVVGGGINVEMPRVTGTVKFFEVDRGYGFIEQEDGSPDVFVHASGVSNGTVLIRVDKVTLSIEDDIRGRGPKAVDVRLA